MTEFLSQFEMNAEMDISKNQWRSTGGLVACPWHFKDNEDIIINFE